MNWAVIMAGGKGTRFWPLSRMKKPKQLLSIITKKSLLEEAVDRIKPLIPLDRVIVVTNKVQVAGVRKVLPRLPKKNILAEPLGRNTAACIGWAASVIHKKDPQGTIMVLPSDHHIPDQKLFLDTLKKAAQVAQTRKAPVTLGIRPTFPSTGYGYLKRGKAVKGIAGAFALQSFHEKPSFEKARDFVSFGYLWNSGMFVWTVPVILSAIAKYLPTHHKLLNKLSRSPKSLAAIYPKFPNISIDYGVMEKIAQAFIVESKFRWNDIGSWENLRDYWPEDLNENVSRQELITHDSRGNLIEAANKKVIALLGVKNLAVIDTPDALLVADKNRLQEVRAIVKLLEKKNKKDVL